MKIKNIFLWILLLIFCSNNIFCQDYDEMREELNTPEEDVNTLWEKAQAAIGSNNIDLATGLLEQIVINVPHDHPLFAQSNIFLANIYGDKGNTTGMKNAIKALETFPSLSDKQKAELENIKSLYNAVVKNNTPFEEDLCGIWVSDFSFYYQEQVLPFIILKISKNSQNNYSATILPYCTLAKYCELYVGIPFKYLAYTENYEINADVNYASFVFGNEKIKTGNKELANVGVKAVGEVGEYTKQAIRSDPNKKVSTKILQEATVGLTTETASALIMLMTVPSVISGTINMNLRQLLPGCAELVLYRNKYSKSNDGRESFSSKEGMMMMYKLYPDYNIKFAANGYELFGHKEYTKEEIVNSKEYKELAKRSIKLSEFNKQAYRDLAKHVTQLCQYTSSDENLTRIIQDRLEHAPQGFLYQEIIFNKGKNSRQYILPSEQNYDLSEYQAKFKNDSQNSRSIGSVYKGWINRAGRKQDGHGRMIWNLGKGKYRDYTGEWQYGKISGKGKMTNADGETVHGIWKNGKLVEEW